MKKIDPEKKKKAKKVAKGLLIFGAGATIAVGGIAARNALISYGIKKFENGRKFAQDELRDFNYCRIKHDVTDGFISMAVKDSYTPGIIPKIGSGRNGVEKFSHIVGEPNKLEFVKRLCKDDALKEQIKLIATAEKLEDVKTF